MISSKHELLLFCVYGIDRVFITVHFHSTCTCHFFLLYLCVFLRGIYFLECYKQLKDIL